MQGPIGAAKGKQTNTMASGLPPPPLNYGHSVKMVGRRVENYYSAFGGHWTGQSLLASDRSAHQPCNCTFFLKRWLATCKNKV